VTDTAGEESRVAIHESLLAGVSSLRGVAGAGLLLLATLLAACDDPGAARGGRDGGAPDGAAADGGEADGGAPDEGAVDASGDGGDPADLGGDEDCGADGARCPFDDHTVATVGGLADLQRLLVPGAGGRAAAKFLITSFHQDDRRQLLLFAGDFYAMHDEWYWFRLLNGQPVPGASAQPVAGLSFATVAEIVRWAETQASLPLDLTWVMDGRLYSPAFYELALQADPRRFGLGSLLYLPARPGVREELWLFELEYGDRADHAILTRYFEVLDASLPPELAGRVKWVVRSPAQESLAVRMETERLRYWDRIVRYGELVVPGEVEVYNPGIAAGRAKLLRADEGLGSALATDVLILDGVPDWLPPAAALVTALPQTPLAHINILAKNRGIPNSYRGGAAGDPGLEQLARAHAPVLVYAAAPATLRLLPLGEAQYAAYRALLTPPALHLEPVDVRDAPRVLPLTGLSFGQSVAQRSLLGGKAAGMIALLAQLTDDRGPVAAPPRPVAVTIRPYVEHLAPLQPRLAEMLQAPDFVAQSWVRLLVLEGEEEFAARQPDPLSRANRERFFVDHPPGDVLRDLVDEGGLRQVIKDLPVAAATLAEITAVLAQEFGSHATTQGLRFRSSSNVEDLEGFNGAGLYESFTGFLHADTLSGSDRKKTVSTALRKTWASYWAAEAFEERRLAGVDHLAGAMGVLVHARFDDELEAANGVLTMTLLPAGGQVLDVNLQVGALSVTNPETEAGALPEVDRLEQGALDEPVTVTRVRGSTELPVGQWVASDEELRALFREVRVLATTWLAEANAGLPRAQQGAVTVLDLEVRRMAPGWPALAAGQGPAYPARLVLKQVRSLDPGLSRIPEEVRSRPFPRDLLARARRVERRVCTSPALTLIVYEALSDPARPPDMGWSTTPFTALALVSLRQPLPALGLPAGHTGGADHTGFARVAHPATSGRSWDLQLEIRPDLVPQVGFATLAVTPEGGWQLGRDEAVASGAGLRCVVEVPFASPSDYLLELLQQAGDDPGL